MRFRIQMVLLFLLLIDFQPPQALEVELRFLPFWECRGVDIEAAETLRPFYFQALKDEALQLLVKNQETVKDYVDIYTQEILQLPAGDPDRQGARTQRKNFLKTIQSQNAWQSIVDFYEQAVFHVYHVEKSIRGIFQWSCYYPEDAEKELLDLLEALTSYGIEVVSGDQIVIGERAGQRINPDDGLFHTIDLDRDIRSLLSVNFDAYSEVSQYSQDLWEHSRIFELESLVQRDYFRAQAFLSEAKESMPILDVRVPEGIRRWWIFRPTIKEIVLREADSNCRAGMQRCLTECGGNVFSQCTQACVDGYVDCAAEPTMEAEIDFWIAMREALKQIQTNIRDESSRIQAITLDDIEQLLVLPQVRLSVLGAHPEFTNIDCIATREWTEQTVKDFRKKALYVAQGVLSLGGGILTLTGNVPMATLCFTAAWALGIPQSILLYQEYKDAERGYFTAITGYGLYPRELYSGRMIEFNLVVAQTILDGIFTLPQAWKLYRAVIAGKLKLPDWHRLVRLISGANPEQAQALTTTVLQNIDDAVTEPAEEVAEQVTKALDEVDPVVRAMDDTVPDPVAVVEIAPKESVKTSAGHLGALRAQYPQAQPFRIVDDTAVAEDLTFEKINDLLEQFGREATKNGGKPSIGIEVPKTFFNNPTLHIGELDDFFTTMAEANVRQYHSRLGTSYYIVAMKDGRPRYISQQLLSWLQNEYWRYLNPNNRWRSIQTAFSWLSSGDEVIGYGQVHFTPPNDYEAFFAGATKLNMTPMDPLFEKSVEELGSVPDSYFLAGKSNYPTLLEILQEFAPRVLDVFEPGRQVSFYLRFK